MLVTMTDKELYRLGIIQRVFDRALLQRDAADILKLSVRQVQRLVRLYRTDGATAFASSRRGRPANNRIDEETRCKALDLIRCHYSDFGPTLATEKLAERHHIYLSVETIRNWMTADGLWRPHSRRRTGFTSRAIVATVSANWFRSMALTMTGSKEEPQNAVFWSSWMTPQVA